MVPSLFNQAEANTMSAKSYLLSFGDCQMGFRCFDLSEQELSRSRRRSLVRDPFGRTCHPRPPR